MRRWKQLLSTGKCLASRNALLLVLSSIVYDIVQVYLQPEIFGEGERTQDNKINMVSEQSSSSLITGNMANP